MALAQRQVTVQESPLYRTEGSHITIWCKVSGYQGPSEQNFQWSIYLPSAPEREVQIISTMDPSFPYAIYTQRVRSGEIYIERVQGDSALLHITELQDRDAGEYECHTPTTDERYFGSYSAKMKLMGKLFAYLVAWNPHHWVLWGDMCLPHPFSGHLCPEERRQCCPDSSTLSSPSLPPPHPFLFVLPTASPFLSTLSPAPSHAPIPLPSSLPHSSSHFLALPPPMALAVVQERDLRHLEEDDSGRWERAKQAASLPTPGVIISCMCTPFSSVSLETSISVEMTNNASSVLEGESLRFGCSVRSGSGPQSHFSVTWQLVDKQNRRSDVVRLDRDGTLQPGPSYSERSSYGGIQMEQVRPGSFTLEIFNSVKADEGHYECRVTEWTRAQDGEWQMIGERHASTPISITALEAGFAVTAISRTPGVTYNESFDLQCIIKPHYPSWVPVSVTWRFQPAGSTEFHDLVTFTRDGGVQWGDRYTGFRTRTAIEKAESSNNVRLSISRASDTEAGKYQCVAELWRKNYNSSWTRLADRTSNLLEIRVLRPVTKLQVSKSKRSITLVENRPILLNCSVKSQTSPDSHFAVLWYVHKPSDADGKLILKTTHSSAFEYGTYAEEEGLRGRLQFERSSSGGLFSLTVQRAEVSDSGSYYCHVEEWLLSPNHAWYKLAEEVSGRTEVTVKQPDNRLQVNQTQKNLTVLENQWVTLECTVTSRTSPASQLSVEWYVWKSGHPEKEAVARLNRQGTLQYGELASLSDLKSRLHLESPSPGLYLLTIQNLTVRDSGAYDCRMEEWLLDPSNQWYKRAEDLSGLTTVTVKQPDPSLQVDTAISNLTVLEKEPFPLDCSILSRSSQESRFAVTWYNLRLKEGGGRASHGTEEEEEREALMNVGPDAVFGPEAGRFEGRLRFQRLSSMLYRLTVLQAGAADAGNYSCRVEEWVPDPKGVWYRLTEEESGTITVHVQDTGSSLQSIICSNDALFYFVFFYPFPIFGILIITILLVRFKSRNSSKNSDGKNGVPLLWIKEPHLNYSPTCLEPPVLSIHPGTID
uniref:Immunoglobulin superfamily member 3 n=1 Tax=Pelusios castaneus TaxID=367368 RepID=A0A8C8RBI0_9SAUR